LTAKVVSTEFVVSL